MEKTRHYTLRIGIVIVIICDTLKRILYGARPIDKTSLVVELLVLALITYEVGSSIWHRIRQRRRSRRVLACFVQGKALEGSAPRPEISDGTLISNWTKSVETWSAATLKLLTRYSAEASAAFLHQSGGIESATTYNQEAAVGARETYKVLRDRLDHLHDIIKRPDVYF